MLVKIVQVYTDSTVSVEIPEILRAEYRQAGKTHMRFSATPERDGIDPETGKKIRVKARTAIETASKFFAAEIRKAKRANNGVTQSSDRTGMAKLNDKLEPVRQPPRKHGPYDDGVKRYKTFAQK